MSITLGPLVAAAILLATAGSIRQAEERGRARAKATFGALIAAALSMLAASVNALLIGSPLAPPINDGAEVLLAMTLLPAGLLSATSAAAGIAGVLACALAPIASHPPLTLRRMLLVLAAAQGFVATTSSIAHLILWAASALIVWRELSGGRTQPTTASIFVLHHGMSILGLFVAVLLASLDQPVPAMICALVAVAIRESIMPLHGWFPVFVEEAPLGMVVVFAAPQLGIYAHLQLFETGLPATVAHVVAAFGVLTAFVASALGTVQTNARRALAWLMISQSGLVAFGLENSAPAGRVGALLTWQVLAIAGSGFAMTLAALEARRGSLALRGPGGSFARTPRMAVAFLVLGFASVGLPGTLGFIAEDLLVQGSVEEYPLMTFGLIVATALNGVTVMRCFFALFSGSRRHVGEPDLVNRERLALTIAVAVLVFAGLWPQVLLTLHGSTSVTLDISYLLHFVPGYW